MNNSKRPLRLYGKLWYVLQFLHILMWMIHLFSIRMHRGLPLELSEYKSKMGRSELLHMVALLLHLHNESIVPPS